MSEVLAVRSEYRIQQWTQIIEECRCSGLSNREFCRRHDICEKTYCYWLRRVRKAAILRAESEQPSLVPLENDSTELRDSLEGCGLEAVRSHRHGYGCGTAEIDSTAMIDLSRVRNYYVACGYTDLRRGIDGLASIVTQQY